MFKAISADNYTIRPFLTHKTQTYSFTSGSGSNPAQIAVDLAVAPASSWRFSTTDPVNDDGIFQYTLYKSVAQLFYTSASVLSGSISGSLVGGLASGNLAMNWAAGGDAVRKFPLTSSVWVIGMAQSSWGEGIREGSVRITSLTSTGSILDDGNGRLYVGNTASIVGNIFYNLGIATVQPMPVSSGTISNGGLYFASGTTLTISFDASQTIYEHQMVATIQPYEFNFSTNFSAQATASSGQKIPDLFLSGNLTPYVSTVGFYNNQYQLIAVAKFPQPIKRILESQQTFIVRLDA